MFEGKELRRMFRPKKEEVTGIWRSLYRVSEKELRSFSSTYLFAA
jgi:hypothetical protein